MAVIKRGLGKGLGALIPQGGIFTGGRSIVNLDINNVTPNPRQPRTAFNKDSLDELSASIQEQGIIEPILVRMRAGKYELVAGERRWRAAKLAGIKLIPAIVKEFRDQQSLELAIVENLQREDLNPLDEAEGYAKLIAEFNLTQDEVAKKVSKNRSTVTNMLRILKLPEKMKQALGKGKITLGHARALLAIEDAKEQMETFKKILADNLNVRDVEAVAGIKPRKIKKGGRKRAFTKNAELNALVEKLTTHFGTKIKVLGTPERGKIEIDYFSKEDLERVLDLIFKNKA